MFYYFFWYNGIFWNYPSMVYRVFGAPLRGGVSIGGLFNGYAFVFYFFFFALERSLSMHGPLESLLAYFRKTPINPIYSGLNIAV